MTWIRDYAIPTPFLPLNRCWRRIPQSKIGDRLHGDEVLEEWEAGNGSEREAGSSVYVFSRLSYTKAHGDIDYLQESIHRWKPGISFQMQVIANEYYPGLTKDLSEGLSLQHASEAPLSSRSSWAPRRIRWKIKNACAPIAHPGSGIIR